MNILSFAALRCVGQRRNAREMALPNNFAEGLMSFKQGIKDMKRIFNPTGPGLPEADAAMVADAERLYAEGSISPRSRSGSRTSVSYTHLTLPTICSV